MGFVCGGLYVGGAPVSDWFVLLGLWVPRGKPHMAGDRPNPLTMNLSKLPATSCQ